MKDATILMYFIKLGNGSTKRFFDKNFIYLQYLFIVVI